MHEHAHCVLLGQRDRQVTSLHHWVYHAMVSQPFSKAGRPGFDCIAPFDGLLCVWHHVTVS